MEDDKVLTPQEIWQMQLEHQRKIEKELEKLTSPGPDWQEDVEKLYQQYQHWEDTAYAEEDLQLWAALHIFFLKYHTNKQNHD